MVKCIKILFLFLLLNLVESCKIYDGFGGNPHCKGCSIQAENAKRIEYGLSDYLKNIRVEVKDKIELPENINEILLTETVDGGDGIHELRLVFFNEAVLIPVKIIYEFKDREEVTKSIELGKVGKQKSKKFLKIFSKIKKYGEWNLSVNCFSATVEQKVTFYVKKDEEYFYFAKFENFYFTKNPSIGIDDDILFLIKMLESI